MSASKAFTVVELTIALLVSAVLLASGHQLFIVLKNAADRQDQLMAQTAEVTDALEQVREDLLHSVPAAEGRRPVFTGGAEKMLVFYSLCLSDLCEGLCGPRQVYKVEYTLVKEGDLMGLYRIATPIVAKDTPVDGSNKQLLCGHIEEAEVFFHDRNRLVPSFSSDRNLPVCVQLKITAYGRTWPLLVGLPCANADGEQLP
jgi:type II secretory pathway pseudopilin PulG